jgi:tetratricopeptide (TPR) repeat protein
MIKSYSIFLVILLAYISGYSQVNPAEAKAAYLLAEEQFAVGNYKAALEFLQTASDRLGGANSKILYLQIQAENELSKGEPKYLDSLTESIKAFEKAPDHAQFNEEKVMEVVKLKLLLKSKISEKDRIANFTVDSLKFGSTAEEAKLTSPAYFNGVQADISATHRFYTSVAGNASFYNGRLGDYSKTVTSFMGPDADTQAQPRVQEFVNKFTGALKTNPQVSSGSLPGLKCAMNITNYVWQIDTRTFKVSYTLMYTGKHCETPVALIQILGSDSNFKK